MRKTITLCFAALGLLLIACDSTAPVPTEAIVVGSPTIEIVAPTDSPTELAPTTDSASVPTIAPTPLLESGGLAVNVASGASDLSISAENIFLYPPDQLHTGDHVTFQVYANVPEGLDPQYVPLHIYVDDQLILDGRLGGWRNLAGEAIGLYQWVWYAGDMPGEHLLKVVLDPDDILQAGDTNPDNNTALLAVGVSESAETPPTWQTANTHYANVHVVTGTAAHRDLQFLVAQVDAAIVQASNVLQLMPTEKLEIYFVDRVIGQGGYAGAAMVISYLDRDYSGGGLYETLVHEAIHLLDDQLVQGAEYRFLTEGLAVWATGGHYEVESLDQRAAGLLLDTRQYIPLDALINNFYPAQHEIGYLEAGAFVKYLVDSYGWETVRQFYGNLINRPDKSLADSVSESMTYYFGKTLAQLEAEWHTHLRAQPHTAEDTNDLLITVEFYDLMRRYQLLYDPTAHFLYAWLPAPEMLRVEGISADLTRHPSAEVNVILELMLASADNAIQNNDFTTTRALLESIERTLDNGGNFVDPLAQNYQKIVRTSADLGYEAQSIQLHIIDGRQQAQVVVADNNSNLSTLTLSLDGTQWIVSQ